MPKRKVYSQVRPEKRIKNYSIGLREDQRKWLEKNKYFQVHKFFRDKLDEYIKQKDGETAIE